MDINWEAVSAISTFLTFVAILVSLYFIWQQVKAMRDGNRISWTLKEVDRYTSAEYQELLSKTFNLLYKNGESNLDQWDEIKRDNKNISTLLNTFNYYEKIAIQYDKGLIDKQTTYTLMGDIIVFDYDKYKWGINKLREFRKSPLLFSNWENLANQFLRQKHSKKK